MSVEEAISGESSPLQSALTTGLDAISQNQIIEFTQYTLLILPVDGYVFWVKTGNVISVKGSIHVAVDQQQNQDETLGINHVIFTSEQEVNPFNDVSPTTMYIGTFEGLKFAFNNQRNFYRQASLWHYRGNAVYPAMETQLLDSATGFDVDTAIVSNSLPIWLALNDKCPMYPSFLVSPNIVPPYASVDITATTALQTAPWIDLDSTHNQLCTENVLITLYGLRNPEALDFQDYLYNDSVLNGNWGLMNAPAIVDEKRTQSEMSIIAQKKSLSLSVSYYQSRAQDVARQLILTAPVNYYPQGGVS